MTRAQMRTTVLAIVLLGATTFVAAATPRAVAQTPTPPAPPPSAPAPFPTPAPPQRGDIVWTFAHEPPLFDLRVAMALATLMEPLMQPHLRTAGVSQRVMPVIVREPGLTPEPPRLPAAEEVPKLLVAAGFPPPVRFVEAGSCQFWAGPGASAAAPAIGLALRDALASLGLSIQLCVATAQPEDAHVLVWVAGEPPPVIPRRAQPTFLSWSGFTPLPAATPAGQAGTTPLRLPAAGVGTPGRDNIVAWPVAGLALALMVTLMVALSGYMRGRV